MSSGQEKSAVFLDVVDVWLLPCLCNCSRFPKSFRANKTMPFQNHVVLNPLPPDGSKVREIQCCFRPYPLCTKMSSGYLSDTMDCKFFATENSNCNSLQFLCATCLPAECSKQLYVSFQQLTQSLNHVSGIKSQNECVLVKIIQKALCPNLLGIRIVLILFTFVSFFLLFQCMICT